MLFEAEDYPIHSFVSQIGVSDVCMAFILRVPNRAGEVSLLGNRYPCTEVCGYMYRGEAGFFISHTFSSNFLLLVCFCHLMRCIMNFMEPFVCGADLS